MRVVPVVCVVGLVASCWSAKRTPASNEPPATRTRVVANLDDRPVALFAKLRDASGLPPGTRVVLDGLVIGKVTRVAIEGGHAVVRFELRAGTELWSSATVIKKSASLLSEHYLEIDPGQRTDGTREVFTRLGPACATYDDVDRARADRCREVREVIESVDQVKARIDQTLPNVGP
jgi:ABC-type transporter Mla subunit MlaD